ncbi:hypothetical protein EC973_004140 [Apophysomyces ossiformis]|uniref:Integrase zinc-binding domain-containing protein n=1 Tax=Apophysomyces ossiformis TaxID=679940 RepID=A0A8H7BEY6_9FUNG|nr:hypothetical protein EC973_004140 [Apophysomyces ossiformis]
MNPFQIQQLGVSYHHNNKPTSAAAAIAAAAAATAAASSSHVQQRFYPQMVNDRDQYPSSKEFDAIVEEYLQNLSSKKRDKALVDQHRYSLILQVLKDPRNTAISTAQFRFWVKKMFQLAPIDSCDIVCHDNKPVAMREQIYGILVRRRYSWIPKELIARFVRHCPFCISRRNGCQSPVTQTPPSLQTDMKTMDFDAKDRHENAGNSNNTDAVNRKDAEHSCAASSLAAAAVATSAAAVAVALSPASPFECSWFYYSQPPYAENSLYN